MGKDISGLQAGVLYSIASSKPLRDAPFSTGPEPMFNFYDNDKKNGSREQVLIQMHLVQKAELTPSQAPSPENAAG